MFSPYAVIAALVVWIGSVGGVWFYRGHIDSTAVLEAQERIENKYAQAAAQAQKDAETHSLALQAQADSRALALQQSLDVERTQYAKQLADSRAALRKLPKCPVPVAAVGMLLDTQSTGSVAKDSAPRDTPGNPSVGTVDASAIIATCEINKRRFEANWARANACFSMYDDARKACGQ